MIHEKPMLSDTKHSWRKGIDFITTKHNESQQFDRIYKPQVGQCLLESVCRSSHGILGLGCPIKEYKKINLRQKAF